MLDHTRASVQSSDDGNASGRALLPTLCLWTGFLSFSFCHAPIPGINEPHYLTKSLHSWDASWCAGDFFLESSNAHLVFYRTIGALTVWMSFEKAAFVGRLLAYLLLAVAWQRICTRLTGDDWSGCISGAVFLLLASIGNFSGEWVVGGVEAKVFAYGFILAGMASLLSNRFWQAGLMLGCGVAMHPLVGLWAVIAMSMAAGWSVIGTWRRSGIQVALTEARTFAGRREVISAGLLFASVSAWGVVPALASVLSADERTSFAANYLQVFFRLRHHLDPMDFKPAAYIGYTLLAVVAWLLHRQTRSGTAKGEAPSGAAAAMSFFSRTIVCSGIIAITGVLIGLGPRPPVEMPFYEFRMNLLKFYPFRLFDVALPILVSIQVAMLLSERRLLCVLLPARSRMLIVGVCFCSAMYLNAGRGSIDRMTDAQRSDWRDVCGWLRENAPHESLFLTPKESRTFKWFAEKPEYVAFKDCPQDAAGIVEWNRRLRFLKKWGQDSWNGQSYSAAVAQELHETTGITHIVTRRWGPFEVPVIYRNATFRVYQINAVR